MVQVTQEKFFEVVDAGGAEVKKYTLANYPFKVFFRYRNGADIGYIYKGDKYFLYENQLEDVDVDVAGGIYVAGGVVE